MNIMTLNNYGVRKPNLVLYEGCFDVKQCDELQELQKGRDIIKAENDEIVLSNYRHTKDLYSYDKCFLDETIHEKQEGDNQPKDIVSKLPENLEEHLMQYVFDANVKQFGYEIWGMESDPIILTFKENDYYDFHEDILWYDNEPNDRKLKGYVFLSDNTICKGGDLVFDKHAELSSPLGAYNVRGNLILFPSFLSYAFTKVKQGFFQVLTFDIIGPNLK